jgi:hypothetical protein
MTPLKNSLFLAKTLWRVPRMARVSPALIRENWGQILNYKINHWFILYIH